MRFVDLAVGMEFMLEGVLYRKTSPILATDHGGKSRLIPRSANIQPAGSLVHSVTSAPHSSELEQFYRSTLSHIEQYVQDVTAMTELKQAVEITYRQLEQDKKNQNS